MARDVLAGALGERRSASTAGGGTALTTTATFIRLPKGTSHVAITPRNFSTAVVAKVAFNPWLTILKATAALTTAPTDYSAAGQDFNAAAATMVLSSLDTLANNNFLLVGAHLPFRGVLVDVNATNSNAATLAVKYWNGAWTNITPTDGTALAGATFGQDGNVTWTVPTDWKLASLQDIYSTIVVATGLPNKALFWTRWDTSAAFDASVTLDRMLAMNRNTAQYAELVLGWVQEERVLHGVAGGIGCIEALTDAGTANLIVNVYAEQDGGF